MKNLLNFKRLLSYSHEKQSPLRFGRYAAMLMMLLTLGAGQMWAATSTTLYFCPGLCGKDWTSAWVNVCTKYNSEYDQTWSNMAMTEVAGVTVDGHKVYSKTFTDLYDGARTIEFHKSENNWDGKVVPFSNSWTGVSTYNGKLCNAAGNGWITYVTDKTATVSAGSNGSVSPSGTVNLKAVSGTSITASPSTNYAFVNWTISGGGITPSSSSNATETFKATSTGGSITANFAPQWNIKGSGTEMGNWGTYNALNYVSTNTFRGSITLAANTVYEFKVVDRKADAYYGYGNAAGKLSFVGQTSASPVLSTGTENIRLMTAGAGSYTFEWNSSSKTLTVTYPSVTHPSTDYIYFKDDATPAWTVAGHLWGGSSNKGTVWGSNPALSSFTFNGDTYYYMATGDHSGAIFGQGCDNSHKTADLTISGNKRKWYSRSGANWNTFTLSITYKDQGGGDFSGSQTSPPTTHTYGSSTTLKIPTKTGYNFAGWFTASDCASGAVGTSSSASLSATGYTADITLYAKWTAKQTTITLDLNGGDAGDESVVATYDSALPDFTLATKDGGYNLTGYWTGTSDGTKVINADGSFAANDGVWNREDGATLNLYARWSADPGVSLSAAKTSGINVGETVRLTATGSNASNITQYAFYEGETLKYTATTSAGSATYDYTPSVAGVKTMKVIMTYNSGSNTVTSNNVALTLNVPSVSSLTEANSTTQMWIGVDATSALTFTAASSNVSSGATVTWSITDASSGTFTQTDAGSYTGKSWTYTPASTGAKTITVTMSIGGNNYTRTYNLTVYERWNIYVQNNCSWGAVALYQYGNGTNASWPGVTGASTACEPYTAKWYKVTLDSYYPYFILDNNVSGSGQEQLPGGNAVATNKGTYAANSYWDFKYKNESEGVKYYDLRSISPSAPTVSITSTEVISSTQIKLTGTISNYGSDGSSAASHLKEVGFYCGETKHSTTHTSGNTFTKVITGLSAGTEYTFKAYAVNVKGEGKQASGTNVTTRAGGTYTIKVRTAVGATAPKLYAWTPADANDGVLEKNATYGSGAAMTAAITGTVYKWWSYELDKTYNKFLIYQGTDGTKTNDITAPQAATCYWYNSSNAQASRYGTMDCPHLTPQLYIETTAGNEDYDYHEMTNTSGTLSKSLTLAAKSTYKFKIFYNGEYFGKSSAKATRASKTVEDLSAAVEDYVEIETDAAGSYTFEFTTGGKDLTVTYPTRRQVNYSAITKVNGTGNSAVLTAENDDDSDYAISNGGYVADGNSVTFRAPAANIGYTFRGWFSKDNPSDWEDGLLEDDADYTVTINADLTVYAVYSENDYTVTVNATTGGSITTPAEPATTVIAHPATGTPIVAAKADEGWHFTGWTSASDKVTFADEHALTTTVTTTADATIQANFVRRYALYGSRDNGSDPDTKSGLPGWSPNEPVDFTGTVTTLGTADGANLTYAATLEPNKKYKFQVYDRALSKYRGASADNAVLPAEANPSAKIYNNWELNAGTPKDVHIYTVGYGTYTFHITKISNDDNRYPSIQVDRQSSKQLTLGKKVIYNNDNSSLTNADTEGTVTAKVVENEPETGTPTDYFLTSGQYYADGSDITFAAETATGYKIVGWYSDVSCSTPYEHDGSTIIISTNGAKTESTLVLKNCTTAKTVYVKFEEIMTAVTISHNTHGHVTVGGVTATSTTVGITTTRALVAVPDAGYYFAGWTIEGSDIELQDKSDDEDATVTLHGRGAGTAAILTANFVEEDKIYFRNIDQSTGNKLWDKDNIYVYFATTWYDGKGVQTLSNYAEMSPAFDTKIYWAYVPHAFTTSGNTHVAFSDVDMHTNSEFYNNHGVYRTDYNKALNMFVPNRTSSGPTNGTVYHSNGYWKVYDPKVGKGQGYYLQLHTGKGSYDQKGEFTATADGATTIEYTMRVDNTSTQTQYRIASAGGVHYTASATITSAACENVIVNEYQNCTDCYFTVTPTSEGDYKFIIDQDGDQMHITIDYPVSVGDYRLKHTYNDGSDKTTYSDVIKSSGASTSRTLSMYLNASSGTLVLQKYTTIDAGVPAWDAGDTTNLGGILTTVGTNGNGVYQFDVAVSADKVASAPTATKYTGPYYIKTDGATGGWVNYKQNSMDENTLNFDAEHPDKSFNYYYCKYYDAAGKNLKCVIANDYCNALTDTLIGDDVLGLQDAKPRQTTPSAVSVRFSYNSYTNEIKRSYLGASTTDDFLRVLGNTTASAKHIYDKNETTFNDANADSYIKFEDKQNWRYEIEINADVDARAKLTATFNSQTQYFMGAAGESGHEWDDANTEQLFGGASGTYGLTLVYDFKTNKLIRAWKPTGSTISEDLTLESDVFLLREHQGAPAEITFGTIGETDVYASLKEVKTVYSVLRLNRWRLSNRAYPNDVNTEHCKTPALINEHHPALTVNQNNEAGKWLPQAERELYFISFPYNVKMSDIIHFGGYYDKWGIMYYDGKNRAKNGYWIDSESNWKYFTPEEFATGTLNAYEGYLIGIDLDQMRYDNTGFWTNNSSEVDIYFPSKEPVSTITQQEVTVPIDTVGYQCTINRTYGGNDGDRRIKDSHWHCIGVPAYANLTQASTHTGEPDENTNWKTDNLLYIYSWRPATNDHVISDAGSFTFNAMYAYLVQYSQPTLSWAAAAVSPTTPAARRMKTEELRDRQFNLQLMQGGKEADHTYIRLSDDEEVTTGFEFNHDVSKMMLSGANIYTLIGKEQAAANSLPLNLEQTTVVPVGVKIATAGDYTFAIPEGTDGVGVVLIDNLTGTRTNLALTDYTVSLTTGKIENRFSLEISPIQHTPTGIDNVQGESAQSAKARKVMIDGILYIVKDGKVFDACGNRVK